MAEGETAMAGGGGESLKINQFSRQILLGDASPPIRGGIFDGDEKQHDRPGGETPSPEDARDDSVSQ